MSYRRTFVLIFISIILLIRQNPDGSLHADTSVPAAKKRIAVLDIDTNNIPVSYGNIARNSVEVFLFDSGKFQLLDRERLLAVAGKLGILPSSRSSISELLRLGKNLSADYLVSGSVDKLDQYRITVRFISVDTGEVVSVLTQSFSSVDKFETALNGMSQKIVNGIDDFSPNGEKTDKTVSSMSPYMGVSADYLMPLSNLSNLLQSGPGINGRLGMNDVIFNNVYAGMVFGYYRLKGKVNKQDNAEFIPIQLSVGYRYIFSRWIQVKGELTGGLNLITLSHATGDGFSLKDNSRKKTVDPVGGCGVILGFTPVEKISLDAGVRYGIDFERDGNLTYLNMLIGLSANF